jgi:hypothetical protein
MAASAHVPCLSSLHPAGATGSEADAILRCSRSPLPPSPLLSALLTALTACPTLLCGLYCTGAESLEERVMSMLREREIESERWDEPISGCGYSSLGS